MRAGIKVFAPATVANVACGYDMLGFALEKPGDEIIARFSEDSGLRISKITGAKGKLPYAVEQNTAGVAAACLLEFLGDPQRGIELEIHKKMPFGSGLGSSAASAVAGVVAVNELLSRPLEQRALLPFAVKGEQIASGAAHADNVAPSLLGGMMLVTHQDTLEVHRLPTPTGMTATVIYPHVEVLTKVSRSILREQIPLDDHIRQSGLLAGLVIGCYRGDIDLIGRSLRDEIIEPQRAELIPQFHAVQEAALAAGALGCSISGAGPSIFALSANTFIAEQVGDAMQRTYRDAGIEFDLFISPVNHRGAYKL